MPPDPPKLSELFGSVDSLLDYMYPLLIVASLVMVIYGAYMWIASTGDPQKLKQAQGVITWALLGLVFVVATRSILAAIFSFVFS
ncbi:hypothetical protein GF357_05275 [Candidatus Dojkabacteria bacterium]|nr:hypothetical protein [Candidatus Dojkabacteria bacterium]